MDRKLLGEWTNGSDELQKFVEQVKEKHAEEVSVVKTMLN